jgi:hypothetical protein
MSHDDKQAILADFRSWSGGFSPWECTPEQLVTYCETALPVQYDEQASLAFLTRPLCTCDNQIDPNCPAH